MHLAVAQMIGNWDVFWCTDITMKIPRVQWVKNLEINDVLLPCQFIIQNKIVSLSYTKTYAVFWGCLLGFLTK